MVVSFLFWTKSKKDGNGSENSLNFLTTFYKEVLTKSTIFVKIVKQHNLYHISFERSIIKVFIENNKIIFLLLFLKI